MFRSLCLVSGVLFFSLVAWAFDPASQDDSKALVRHFEKPSSPVGAALQQGSFFNPKMGETLTLMGGTDAFRMQEMGYLEARLQLGFPTRKLKIRNIGWSSDTVYRQQRPMFFYAEKGDVREGSVSDQRKKIEPGVFLLFFGRMESLRGMEDLPAYEQAYQELLSDLGQLSQRMIVISPIPFVAVGPARELAQSRNQVLAEYAQATERIAEESGAVFFDLGAFEPRHFMSNGVNLSDLGQRELSDRLTRALGFGSEVDELIVTKVREKNHLWDQYYRPTNWAFLYGDRQHVPSSRDHVDARKRWFEEELKGIPALIAEKEKEIWALAEGGAR